MEQEIADHLERGIPFCMISGPSLDEGGMRSWDETHNLDPDFIRRILRGSVVSDPDPRGLVLRGIRFVSCLDLDGVKSDIPLHLIDCLLEGGLSARGAELRPLGLSGCIVDQESKPALDADRISIAGPLEFYDCRIATNCVERCRQVRRSRNKGTVRHRPNGHTERLWSCHLRRPTGIQGSLALQNRFSIKGSRSGRSSATCRRPYSESIPSRQRQVNQSVWACTSRGQVAGRP
jgi:hypothetical protein